MYRLEQNFRSTGHILDASNAVISHDPARIPKTLFTRKGAGMRIETLGFAYGSEEAEAIAREIGRRAAHGAAWHDIAVIYRQNRLSRAIEEAFIKARVPFEIVGDVGFWQRLAVKDALALLSLSASPEDRQSDEAFRRVANKPARGLGAKSLGEIEIAAQREGTSLLGAVPHTKLSPKCGAALSRFVQTIRASGRREPESVGERLSWLLEATGYLPALRADDSDEAANQRENLAELISLAHDFAEIGQIMEHAALASGAPGEKGKERVQLLTMHRAKGLEFRHVFLPAWEEGIFPGNNARNHDEERRLAYVALTRAMEQATISWCDYRQGATTTPSRFVDEIPLENRINRWNWMEPQSAARQTGAAWAQTQRELSALGLA
ncbi:ATP-dependent helicase [Kozakia baliensis]|uniref:ATP-dependent helicase n=2 Tax=Kozakia baliensis TaxID=153496 RepID=UPI001D051886|nr:ATP-dependent helicase [Kozakia baliensis]